MFRDDFEVSPPGAEPARAARVSHGKRGKAAYIRVADGVGAGGSSRSLKIQDAADLEYTFNPHFYYRPNHTAGVTSLAFDFKIEADAQWFAEWRDDARPYQVGPRVSVAGGKLHAPGVEPIDLPPGEWVHVEMRSGLGPDSTCTWELAVTLPGQEPMRFKKLPYGRGEFKELRWLGFSSTANYATTFYLDNIELGNSKFEE